MKEQIKEALESIREDWEWWQYPQGGYEIFERESRAIVAYSYPTDQNGRFDGKMIAHVPTWLRWQNERIEELEKGLAQALRQWAGYANEQRMNDIDASNDLEGKAYQRIHTLLKGASHDPTHTRS